MPIQDLGGDKPTDRPAPPPPPSFSPDKEQDLGGDKPADDTQDKKVVDLDLPPPPDEPPPPPPSFSPDKEQDLGGDRPTTENGPDDEKVVDLDLPPPPDEPPPPPPSFTPGSTLEPGPRPESPSDTRQDLGGDKPTGQDTTDDEQEDTVVIDLPPSNPPQIEDQETRGPVIVDQVPAYDQTDGILGRTDLGCIPTAIASVLGYWDQKGYDKLFAANGWDDIKKTESVKAEISSPNHRKRYYPESDNLSIVDTDHTSIANFAETSVGSFDSGWGPLKEIPNAVSKYAGQQGKDYTFSAVPHGIVAGTTTAWDLLTWQINDQRPLLAAIDSGKLEYALFGERQFDGRVDHVVPVVGYDKRPDGNYYGFYNNWDEDEKNIIWARFEPPAPDVEWSVGGLWAIAPERIIVDSPPDYPFDTMLIA